MTVINAILYIFIDWQHNINIIQMYSIYVYLFIVVINIIKILWKY